MHCHNPSTECSAPCPLTGKPFCCNCSCPGGSVCQGDKPSEERGITRYTNDDARVQRKLQAMFTGIPQHVAMKPSPTSVASCAHHPDFLDGVRRQLFHSSPVTEPNPESDYGLQFLRDTPEVGASSPLASPSTPPQGSIRAAIPPPSAKVHLLDPPNQDSGYAYDDMEAQKRLKSQRKAIPLTNSLPSGYINPPFQDPAFADFQLPISRRDLLSTSTTRRDSPLHGLIEQQAPGQVSTPRNETNTNQQLVQAVPLRVFTCQQVAPVRQAKHCHDQSVIIGSIVGLADKDLPSLTMRFQSPGFILDIKSIGTAKQCSQIGELIFEHGVEYASSGRKNRKQELENHRPKLEGRIGKRQGPKREGEKFFLEKKAEVRMHLRYEILSRVHKPPLQMEQHTVRVPFQKVPFKNGLLEVPNLPPEAIYLVLPAIDAHTPADLAVWLWRVQERIVPAFLRIRLQAVRDAFINQRLPKNDRDSRSAAVERADLEATHWAIFEYFVKLRFP